jgi:hypothetical protein
MSTRIDDFDLSTERIGKFLHLGIRPVQFHEKTGDVVASFLLIPTKKFKFEELYESEWEGSYVPLIIYRTANAAILVPHGEEKKWKRLAEHIGTIILMETQVIGD